MIRKYMESRTGQLQRLADSLKKNFLGFCGYFGHHISRFSDKVVKHVHKQLLKVESGAPG